MTQPTCTLPECEKPSRNATKPALCKMHYHRQYRHGSIDKTASKSGVTVSLGRRYLRVRANGHPVADTSGSAYEHRVVLYDHIGVGPHCCHWCDTSIDWLPKADPRALQVDHLDNDGSNNSPANLVPTCRSCNGARGAQRRHDALVEAGWWSRNDTVGALKQGRTARVEDRHERRIGNAA